MAMFFGGLEIPTDARKENYLSYFQESGVQEKLSQILTKMFESKRRPNNPMEYIRKELGATIVSAETLEKLEAEVDDARREIRRLRSILRKLGVENIDESDHEIEEEENSIKDE
ncbi:c-Myc-binding protein homolog [Teleopsis dalmanni]|uniref:c-Myc-binding protein homolog n=1 Tax=Teleopsis dalmanni TaxID=139649 RepID=UPI0018CF959B|nr:c-Myc-binding protein homolog [Teleopsis dalmanni]